MLLLGNGNANTAAYGFCAEGAAVAVPGNVHATACCMAIKGFGTQKACADAAAGCFEVKGHRIAAGKLNRAADVGNGAGFLANDVFEINAAGGVLHNCACGGRIGDLNSSANARNVHRAANTADHVNAAADVLNLQISTYSAVYINAAAGIFSVERARDKRSTVDRAACVL